jgi:hypothetical protein
MSLDYSCAMLSMYNGAVAELGRMAIDVTFTLAASFTSKSISQHQILMEFQRIHWCPRAPQNDPSAAHAMEVRCLDKKYKKTGFFVSTWCLYE